ncbi:hypothetical protein ABDJ41_16240 [Pedobacter sp. ASV1-7]|jgi:hypothetical protein|uniref:hypothetical protein n=1 Tax=Pedobacter sp. ASV1-7 TaxID=3145237 RepID=UPI0032E929F4
MKKLSQFSGILLSVLIVYYGLFNHERPVLLFFLFLTLAIVLSIYIIKDMLNVISIRLIRTLNVKDILLQIPAQLMAIFGIYLLTFNTNNEILNGVFLMFKGIVIFEFLILFLYDISIIAIDKSKF